MDEHTNILKRIEICFVQCQYPWCHRNLPLFSQGMSRATGCGHVSQAVPETAGPQLDIPGAQ